MFRFPSANRNKRFPFSFDKLKKRIRLIVSPFCWCLEPLHMSLVTGLAWLPGRMLLSVHLRNFSPVDLDLVQETKPKWWNINLYRLQLLYGFVDCFNFTTTSLVEKHTRQKTMPFLPLNCDSESSFVSTLCVVPVTRAGVFRWKIFIPSTEISVTKSEISVTVAARLLIWRSRIFFFLKKRAAKRDFRNRASSVDQAHMKRPSSSTTCESESGKSHEDAIKARLE